MSDHGIDLVVLSHPECDSEVLDESDFIGSSELLKDEAIRLASQGKRDLMLITECGTADRVLAETKDHLNLMGSCVMCKHMKKTQLEDILQALQDPYPEQIVDLDEETIRKAKKSIDEMFRLT